MSEGPKVLESILATDPGRTEVWRAANAAVGRDGLSLDTFISNLGIRGLSWVIRRVLDEHYPEDVFLWQDVQYGVIWAGEHSGDDIQKGLKWIALLRMALDEVVSE